MTTDISWDPGVSPSYEQCGNVVAACLTDRQYVLKNWPVTGIDQIPLGRKTPFEVAPSE